MELLELEVPFEEREVHSEEHAERSAGPVGPFVAVEELAELGDPLVAPAEQEDALVEEKRKSQRRLQTWMLTWIDITLKEPPQTTLTCLQQASLQTLQLFPSKRDRI